MPGRRVIYNPRAFCYNEKKPGRKERAHLLSEVGRGGAVSHRFSLGRRACEAHGDAHRPDAVDGYCESPSMEGLQRHLALDSSSQAPGVPLMRKCKALLAAAISVLGAVGPIVASPLMAGTARAAESISTTLPAQEAEKKLPGAKGDLLGKLQSAADSVKSTVDKAGELIDRSVVSPLVTPVEKVRQDIKSQLDTDRQVGEYRLKAEFVDAKIDIVKGVRPALDHGQIGLKGKLGLRTELDPVRMSLSKTETDGPWSSAKGVRGGVHAAYETGYEAKGQEGAGGFFGNTIEGRIEAFKSWERNVGNAAHLSLGITPIGISHDFLHSQSYIYAEAFQELRGEGVPYLGDMTGWKLRGREGAAHNLETGRTTPFYELSAGVTKKIPLEKLTDFMGVTGTAKRLRMSKDAAVELEAGLRVTGNQDTPAKAGPYTGAKIRW